MPYFHTPCGLVGFFLVLYLFLHLHVFKYSRHLPNKPTVTEAWTYPTCPRFVSVLILVLQATSFTSGHPKERTPGPDSQGKVVRFDNFENCNCRTKTKRFMILWYFMWVIVYSVYVLYDCLWHFVKEHLISRISSRKARLQKALWRLSSSKLDVPSCMTCTCLWYLQTVWPEAVHQWTRRGFLDSVQTNLGFCSYSLFCVLWNETCHCCARQVEKEDSIESLWKSLAQAVGL